MNAHNEKSDVRISLSKNEALVLFDWLTRFNESIENGFHHQAEERVLWDLESVLEKTLNSVLSKDFERQLSKAREQLKDQL